jgi:guanylate kinase
VNSSRKRPGLFFTLVGPAGAGKNRLIKHVLAQTPLHQVATATTRPIRPGEQEGREHLYRSVEEFQQMIERGELLEHQVVHGQLYGMPRASIEASLEKGESIIADIEVKGAAEAQAAYPESAVSIFIETSTIGSLIERMRERGESESEIGKRLLRIPMELDEAPQSKYFILNASRQS